MNSQVYLHHTDIKVLALSRKRYWIFQDAVQQLLHKAAKAGKEQSELPDYLNDDQDDDEDFLHISSSLKFQQFMLGSAKTLQSPNTPDTETYDFGGLPIDNLLKKVLLDRLVLTDDIDDSDSEEDDIFFHIAFAETEVTIMCPTETMNRLFTEPIELCKQLSYSDVELVPTEFVVLQVDLSDGYDNLLKVLHVTKPLSTNKIPLYFLLTHYGDVVLVPKTERQRVIDTLKLKNFEFNNLLTTTMNRTTDSIEGEKGDGESYVGSISPTIALENGTFDLFKENGVVPIIRPYSLLLTGSRSGFASKSIKRFANVLASLGKLLPPYFAITRTSLTEVLLLLPKLKQTRSYLGFPSRNITGLTSDLIVPVAVDLEQLPLDSTGIVAGLALRLLSGLRAEIDEPLEMSYFLMAKSGLIMVPKEKVALVAAILDRKLGPSDDIKLLDGI